MKYAVVDERKHGDIYEKVFDSEKDAMDEAEMDWAHMVKTERENSTFYVCSCELDEDECIDYNTIEILKEWNRVKREA